ncbi:hypothetical protein [Fundidesulfovibrio terrae]|uniref:hypothetical protein n=1 Tax=Fundidesulfovibrio terrae TaxID=2922866 RepID=UPI001FAFFC22|nr:hypothetical protein [Fundidesulfovibrio terrae]
MEEFEIDPQDLLLENALRVVFKAAEMLDAEALTPSQLKDLSGALRDATEIVLSIETACGCDHDHGDEEAE